MTRSTPADESPRRRRHNKRHGNAHRSPLSGLRLLMEQDSPLSVAGQLERGRVPVRRLIVSADDTAAVAVESISRPPLICVVARALRSRSITLGFHDSGDTVTRGIRYSNDSTFSAPRGATRSKHGQKRTAGNQLVGFSFHRIFFLSLSLSLKESR